MELQTCMEQRRSIRKFKDTPVSREAIKELVEAAILAPSWKNSQVSRYYAADGENKKELSKYLAEFNQNNTKDAPVLIVSTIVKGKSGFAQDGNYDTHLKEGFQYFDNGLQVENLCLKAQELGLGTLIMGIYDEAGIRKYFNIDDTQEIVAVIGVGYPDIEPTMPKRNAVEDVLFFK